MAAAAAGVTVTVTGTVAMEYLAGVMLKVTIRENVP